MLALVASWETGRNRLSEPFARRMALATGVDAKGLLRGRGPLTCYVPFSGQQTVCPRLALSRPLLVE